MSPERQKKIEQRMAAAEALKAEVRDAYRQDVGGGPPPESTEADNEALRMLAGAWGEEGRSFPLQDDWWPVVEFSHPGRA